MTLRNQSPDDHAGMPGYGGESALIRLPSVIDCLRKRRHRTSI
jgi:hypothetical protein